MEETRDPNQQASEPKVNVRYIYEDDSTETEGGGITNEQNDGQPLKKYRLDSNYAPPSILSEDYDESDESNSNNGNNNNNNNNNNRTNNRLNNKNQRNNNNNNNLRQHSSDTESSADLDLRPNHRELQIKNRSHQQQQQQQLDEQGNNTLAATTTTTNNTTTTLTITSNNKTATYSSANNIALKFLIKRREAGAVIGKRGSNIRQLRDKFNSEFLIPDTGNGPERVLNITTSPKQLDKILKQLSELLYEKSAESDDQVELRMLIHSSHAGTIIGKGGTSIKKLREESKAAIKIFALCCPLSNERVVAIKSKPPIVVNTIKLVLNIIADCSIKGVVKPYDALNFDQSISDRYGGYKYDDTDTPPNGVPFVAPQQLSPLNPFNHPPLPNHFMPNNNNNNNNNYRLHPNPNMSSHQNCPPCRPAFASQIPSPCTNCHHQRAEHCVQFVQHRQLPYHQVNHQCGNRFCSPYNHMPVNGHNNVRNNNTQNGHKFHHIHM